MKKPFKETGFGKLLLQKIPSAIGVIGDVLPDKGILGVVKNIIEGSNLPPEEKRELLRLKNDFEREMYELEIKDRESARNRQIEVAKTGKSDSMMTITGLTGLGAFVLMIIAIIFLDVKESAILHQLIGMIEGVALTIFAYYYGTSKSSKDKDSVIANRK